MKKKPKSQKVNKKFLFWTNPNQFLQQLPINMELNVWQTFTSVSSG